MADSVNIVSYNGDEVISLFGKWKNLILAVVLAWVAPVIIFTIFWNEDTVVSEKIINEAVDTVSTTDHEIGKQTIRVLMDNNTVVQMDIEDYVVCVVLREMPAEFETEALKAQAVVARTYTLRRCANNSKHQNADICTSPSCCQGFYDKQTYVKDGGSEQLILKVEEAVYATKSQVLLYDGELIDATYFSCSGGRTEDAVAVWGTNIPYLQSTDSPGEESALRYTDTVEFSVSEFARLLELNKSDIAGNWIGNISYTKGGGVDKITLSGKSFKGTDIRTRLGIRSTAFTISINGDNIVITTKGFGHRVGMSQYGADAMALQGSSYKEILNHYYKDVVLSEYSGN